MKLRLNVMKLRLNVNGVEHNKSEGKCLIMVDQTMPDRYRYLN